MKPIVAKLGVAALMLGAGGLLLMTPGCSSEPSPEALRLPAEGASGVVRLNLVPVTGVTLNAVSYVVTGTPRIPGTTLPAGVMPTPGASNTVSFGVPVPVGTNYTLSLSAVSAETGDDVICTGSHGPFDVVANQDTTFEMTLDCVDNSSGSVVAAVALESDACPRLVPDYASVIPAFGNIGDTLALNALGHDLDGRVVTYAWSLPPADGAVGTFTDARLAAPGFRCVGPGANVPLTVVMRNGECSKSLTINVSCGDYDRCGDYVLEDGEDCDKAISPNLPGGSPAGTDFGCPADCRVTCGDGIVEPPTEQCELNGGPPTAGCTEQCRYREPQCGDGWISGTEACDPLGPVLPAGAPAGTYCGADCTLRFYECGNFFVEPGEDCDPPSTATCSDHCQAVVSSACAACESTTNCEPFATACTSSTGTPTPADQDACYTVASCIQQTNCADGTRSLTSCFCGTLSTQQCSAAPDSGPGAPNGPCHDQIKAGMGVSALGGPPSNAEILAHYAVRSYAAGAAINRFNCLKNNATCSPLCGF